MIFTNNDRKNLDLASLNIEAILEVVRQVSHQNDKLSLIIHNMDKTMDAMALELSRTREHLNTLETKAPSKPTIPPKLQPANKPKK